MIWIGIVVSLFVWLIDCKTQVSLSEEGALRLCYVFSPGDYQNLIQGKEIKSINLESIIFDDKLASDLTVKFAEWNNLKSILFTSCLWNGDSKKIMIQGLVTNQHIKNATLLNEFGMFAHLFLHALATVPPYLESLTISTGIYYTESKLKPMDNLGAMERAFSTLEEISFLPHARKEANLFSTILPLMKNLKRITLSQGLFEGNGLVQLIQEPQNIEFLKISTCDQSLEQALGMISKMNTLKRLDICHWGKEVDVTRLLKCIYGLKLEQLTLQGDFYDLNIHELSKVSSLKSVTVPFLFQSNERFEKYFKSFSYTYKNNDLPFEVTKKMVIIANENLHEDTKQIVRNLIQLMPQETCKICLFTMKCDDFPQEFLLWASSGKGKHLENFRFYIGVGETDPIIESVPFLPKLNAFYLKRYNIIAGYKSTTTMEPGQKVANQLIIFI